ncbi:MAG TPA: prolyl oligopeptidase family serine peptidase, partial [Acidimicrobiales bacterium]|nr:prolyl oligopeptidase family serine peptidase [Acidimicrobiales bacterium]
RWLEDTDAPETRAWISAENALTAAFLAGVPSREAIRSRLTELWDYPRFGVPFERGGSWFQTRQTGLQNQPTLFVMDSADGQGRVLLDPNLLSEGGTVAVTSLQVTEDGTLLAYATSEGGSDWRTWHVREVATGLDRPDVVEWSKFGGAAWRRDGSGFYYVGMERPTAGTEYLAESRGARLLFHRLGTPQSSDTVVYLPPDPDWLPHPAVSDDDRYLVISIGRGTFPEARIEVLDLEHPEGGLQPLIADFESRAVVITNEGTSFSLLTDHEAERRRVVAVELSSPERAQWREIIPETADTLLEAHFYGGRFVCHYLRDAHSVLRVHEVGGAHLRDIPVAGLSSLTGGAAEHEGIEGRATSDDVNFGLTSFTDAGSLWRHELGTGGTSLVRSSAARIEPEDFVTEQVRVPSDDGTLVPMFLAHRRDVRPDGQTPVLLYGYGGFDIPITPSFTVAQVVWMERGGLLAVANLRGGGEYGRAWHDAGRLANKQNVFDDFCACARWLAGSGWSRADRIAINGGSNGGLLVGACLTQHPELFGAGVAEVGVLDMLRFHKFTIGWAWTSDFGSPEDPEQYQWLRRYSPLHNVHDGESYPPTLLMTGDHDDRVVPGHSFKFAARLQAAQGGDAPILIRVEESAGHGLGKPAVKQIAEQTDFLAFLETALGLVQPA